MRKIKEGSKTALFIELANPDEKGISRWVYKSEFVGKYEPLMFRNGGDWCRSGTSIHKYFIVDIEHAKTVGRPIEKIKLCGFRNEDNLGNQTIRDNIKNFYKNQRCVILGTSNPEVDHKNGRKNDIRVLQTETQKLEDFQPLSKHANDAKRQYCKECKQTERRYDAKKLGYPISFYKGNEMHDGSVNGCEGCFWYDPIEFRRHLKA